MRIASARRASALAPARWAARAAAALPGPCAACRAWCRGGLCAACLERFAAEQPRCARCALRMPAPVPACGACLADPPPFARCLCACDYAFPWDRLISEFKFHAQPELAGVLARLLHGALQRADGPLPDLVLPVPLAPARLAERGYNQAWELARRVAAQVQATADADVLERPLAGSHQAGLPLAERRRNLRGAFHVPPARRTRLRGRHVALVDDVMTSGATLREAASTLLAAGAARVDAWVVARTPAPGG